MSKRRNSSMPPPRGSILRAPLAEDFSETFYNSQQLSQAQKAVDNLITFRQNLGQVPLPSVDSVIPLSFRRKDDNTSDTLSGLDKRTITETTCSNTKQIMKELIGKVTIKKISRFQRSADFTLPELKHSPQKPAKSKPQLETVRKSKDELILAPITEKLQQKRVELMRSLSIQKSGKQRIPTKKPRKARKHKTHEKVPKIEWNFANNVYGSAESERLQRVKEELLRRQNHSPMSLAVPIRKSILGFQ